MRACPAGNGKGACACSYGQVSNIRLRPSPREEHRGDHGTSHRPIGGGNMVSITDDAVSAARLAVLNCWTACESALPDGAADGGALSREGFLQAVAILLVYVARSDGELAAGELALIDQIVGSSSSAPSAAPLGTRTLSEPHVVPEAIEQLYRLAGLLAGPDTPPSHNPVLVMMDTLLGTVFDTELANAADPTRYRQIMGSLRHAAAAEAYDPTLASPTLATIFDEVERSDASTATFGSDAVADSSAREVDPPSVLPVVDPAFCPARLREGESCYAVTQVVLFQESNVVRQVRFGGFSARARLSRSVSYRAGSYNVDRTHAPKIERIGEGTLCLTNERLLFLSNVKNLDLPFEKLLTCATEPARVIVARANSGRLIFEQIDDAAITAFEQLTDVSPEHRLDLQRRFYHRPERARSGWSSLAVIAVIAVVWAALWWLQRRAE